MQPMNFFLQEQPIRKTETGRERIKDVVTVDPVFEE